MQSSSIVDFSTHGHANEHANQGAAPECACRFLVARVRVVTVVVVMMVVAAANEHPSCCFFCSGMQQHVRVPRDRSHLQNKVMFAVRRLIDLLHHIRIKCPLETVEYTCTRQTKCTCCGLTTSTTRMFANSYEYLLTTCEGFRLEFDEGGDREDENEAIAYSRHLSLVLVPCCRDGLGRNHYLYLRLAQLV